MIRMIFQRLFSGIMTLWIVLTITFFLIRCLPGGPFDRDRSVPPEIQRNLEAKYHLGEPWPVQYGRYMAQVLQGDLGPSYTYQSRTVQTIIMRAIGPSVSLGALALLLGITIGCLLGLIAARSRNSWWDTGLTTLGVAGLSTPAFIFGGILVLLFSLYWKILPSAMLDSPLHYILPAITLSLTPFSYSFLLIRTSVKETQTLLFVRVKESFGLKEPVLTLKHILRNALLPLLSVIGPIAAALITGSFAVEYIFAIPGLGKHFVTAVINRDYTLVMGITILYGAILIVFNTLTDIGYGLLDPRLRNLNRGETEAS